MMTDNDAFSELANNPLVELPEPAERARLREAFTVTQTKLAETLGVSRRTIHAWERGQAEPTGENRQRYAQILTLWETTERENKENRQAKLGNNHGKRSAR